MLRMRKILISMTMILSLLTIPVISFAWTNEEPVIVPTGGVYLSNDDWDTLDAQTETGGEIYKAPAGSYVTSTVLSSYTEKNKFIGYNSSTPDWSKAKGYTLHKGWTYSFSASIETKWGTAGVKGSYKTGVDIHFAANPKKASRLAIKSDVKVSKIQYKKWSNGKVIKTWTGLSTKPVGTKTHYVKYK